LDTTARKERFMSLEIQQELEVLSERLDRLRGYL